MLTNLYIYLLLRWWAQKKLDCFHMRLWRKVMWLCEAKKCLLRRNYRMALESAGRVVWWKDE